MLILSEAVFTAKGSQIVSCWSASISRTAGKNHVRPLHAPMCYCCCCFLDLGERVVNLNVRGLKCRLGTTAAFRQASTYKVLACIHIHMPTFT